MEFFKDVGDWFSGAGKTISKEVVKVGRDIGDVAEDVGEIGKFAAEKVTNAVIQVGNAAGDLVGAPDIPEVDFTDRASFLEEKQVWVNQHIEQNQEMIEQAIKVAGKLAKHKADIQRARQANAPLSAKLMNDTGSMQLLNDAQSQGSSSVSFGVEGDASYVGGANASVGINNSIINQRLQVKGFATGAGTVGASVGADVSVEIGFWKDRFDEIGGWAHGLAVGAAYNGGAALSFWWSLSTGKFVGWTVSPQVGFSAEAEYSIGHTWN